MRSYWGNPENYKFDFCLWTLSSYKQDPRKIEQYLSESFPEALSQAQKTGAAAFFVDEASVRSDAHRGFSRGKRGETPVVKNSGGRFGLKVVSSVSPRGDMRFSFTEGRMNSKRFIAFLKELHRDAEGPILVVTDNARYHHSQDTQKFVKSQDGKILMRFLPACSPELNPDEQVWNHAKRRLNQQSIFNKADMKRHLESVLQFQGDNRTSSRKSDPI